MDYSRAPLVDRLAAGYAAGTLRGGARRRYETLLPAHPALRLATRAWQDRLMPLTGVLPPVKPPARVWQRILARIDGRGDAVAASAARPARLGLWRAWAGLASAATLVLAVLLANPPPTLPPVVVVLAATPAAGRTAAPLGNAGTTPASWVASISGDGRVLVTKPIVNVSVAAGRSLELWAIPAGGSPRSLGVIAAAGDTLALKGNLLQGVDTLAVSLEPAGGSPSGAPTGPVLYAGKLRP